MLQNFNEFKTTCSKNDTEFRNRYQIKQECENEPQCKIEIEDSLIQSEIPSDKQITQDDSATSLDFASEQNEELRSNEKKVELKKVQNNHKARKPRWTDRNLQKIPCHVCGKLVSRACYKVHVSLHDDNLQRFQCHICKRSYKQKYNLTAHLNTHTKKVLFPCKEENCGKVFNLASTLQSHHKIMHTDIRDHICNICGRGFAIPSGLSAHMRMHGTEKKHGCAECGKSFKSP